MVRVGERLRGGGGGGGVGGKVGNSWAGLVLVRGRAGDSDDGPDDDSDNDSDEDSADNQQALEPRAVGGGAGHPLRRVSLSRPKGTSAALLIGIQKSASLLIGIFFRICLIKFSNNFSQ